MVGWHGVYDSMNLSLTTDDALANILENYNLGAVRPD